jgi:hypothetical protein
MPRLQSEGQGSMNRPGLRCAIQATAALVVACSGYAYAGNQAAEAPFAASHTKRLLFVSNLSANVRIYSADIHLANPQLLGAITDGATRPQGVWIDRKGTLYVENGAQYPTQANIEEYKHGATSPFRTISDGLNNPGAVAVGSDGTVLRELLARG